MPNEDRTNARQANAWKARAGVSPEAVRGRSRGVFDVLSVLSGAREALPADQIAQFTGMKARNANRILSGLLKYGQVERSGVEYAQKEMEDGRMLPVRQAYAYRLTERGNDRLQWLKDNKPWDKDQEER
jgi:predicted transcriptional regulator